MKNALREKLQSIRVLAMDVDGVLTDGRIRLDPDGNEIKAFHSHDGVGLVLLDKAGYKTAIISARRSRAVQVRARELGIDKLYLGARRKETALERLLRDLKVTAREVCYVGDDLTDLRVLRRVGLAVTVPAAPEEVKRIADYVTKRAGGDGAVREVAELILRANGKWESALAEYD